MIAFANREADVRNDGNAGEVHADAVNRYLTQLFLPKPLGSSFSASAREKELPGIRRTCVPDCLGGADAVDRASLQDDLPVGPRARD